MVKLDDIFSMAEFNRLVESKHIRIQRHPDDPQLCIANYSEKTQFERLWTPETMTCRGLIYYEDTNTVVARSMNKFFNWDDSTQPYPPSGPCLLAPKMDGSLGIMYWQPKGGHAIATRGSFMSDQAQWASRFWWEYGDGGFATPKPGKTYLFEIIAPFNRIVVDYGDREELTLLEVIDNETGNADIEEFDAFEWPTKVERKLLPGFSVDLTHEIPEGEEGFVLYWPYHNYRVKMKSADYIALHKMIFGLSERSVWAQIGEGSTIADICVGLPDEFHPWVTEVGTRLIGQALRKFIQVTREHAALIKDMPEGYIRKDFAVKAVQSPNRGYLFALEDKRPEAAIKEEIWKTLRPVGNKGVVTQSEDVA